ncbi:MAG: DUF1549 and DUF1553 domain-containing protein [Bryobacteraceae bacterium]|nr:DUF1549 and DUF1553 domain-containing protein [Bryobacteraceae bacterium]MDW8379217.1 DUF1553 domain-containing protein [Bryobacterales bacterium]
MVWVSRLQTAALLRGLILSAVWISTPVFAEENSVPAADCKFLIQPDEFLGAQARARLRPVESFAKLGRMVGVRNVDPQSIPRRNFIDDEIFGKLAQLGVRSAPLTTDAEFLRRVSLDLTGRIPSLEDFTSFLADTNPNKREALVDRLIASPEFIDKWTWWLGDLLQVNATATNVNRQINGRNAFYLWLRSMLSDNGSLKDIAYQAVTGSGNNYLMENGAANFVVASITPGGPIQDQYDTMLAKTTSTFLGMGYYDCILCHNGRGRLDQLSLWGRTATRIEAQRMAAFFARQRISNHPEANVRDSFFSGAFLVTDATTGDYVANTTNGNRPPRCAPNATVANNRCSAGINLQPEYHFSGRKPSPGRTWREEFAENMVWDPMFARNLANRLWKELFNLGLVDPVDTMDPARLDPNNPPPEPWTLQATHPHLLEKLAQRLVEENFQLKNFVKLLVMSSAYQLSSRYEGEWKLEYVPLFARHYPRRLEGEEIHDAILKATGTTASYTVQNFPYAVNWAMQLPDPLEPRSNGAVASFLNAFLRGNRDTQPRSQAGSILQQLNLMNDAFVLTRVKVGASPVLRELAARADAGSAVEELFIRFLGRRPSDRERAEGLKLFAASSQAAARNLAVEDLAWVLINKVEFVFSY